MDTQTNPKKLSGLYLITPDDLFEDSGWAHKIELVFESGLHLLQYRNKKAVRVDAMNQSKKLKTLCEMYGAQLFINDDPFLARDVGANSVHLGQLDLQKHSIKNIREILQKKALVGVSCYNDLSLAKLAEEEGADYVSFGCFFESHTKPNAKLVDPSILIEAKQNLSIPVVAIGGITLANAPLLLETKVDMLAVCRGVWDNPDIKGTVKRFELLFL